MAVAPFAENDFIVDQPEGVPRLIAALAAVVAGAIHLVLALADLIPGEPTRGPVFALMGLGYVASAGALLARRPLWDGLVLLYSVGLVLAYTTSRGELPVEPIGIVSKAFELIIVGVAAVLVLRAR